MLPTGCNCDCSNTMPLKNISIPNGILIAFTMVMLMNNAHIICHPMDASQSVGLAWSYFSNPDYLVVHSYFHTAGGPNIFHCSQFFPGGWVTCMRVHPVIIL